ncbi:Hypothetical protein PHPALM_9212 [Phytophthora palmivora]|uniref:Uncharacterized protein n=1 Tax=Phytophthora palmivora TaxID=4796 RepID=A0A2P4Y7V3_9STRA|nr:Hypothetical protein PHPALM_9212 [Phytophthora palmivora]
MDGAAGCGHLDVVKWLHTHRNEGCSTTAMKDTSSDCTSIGRRDAHVLGWKDLLFVTILRWFCFSICITLNYTKWVVQEAHRVIKLLKFTTGSWKNILNFVTKL